MLPGAVVIPLLGLLQTVASQQGSYNPYYQYAQLRQLGPNFQQRPTYAPTATRAEYDQIRFTDQLESQSGEEPSAPAVDGSGNIGVRNNFRNKYSSSAPTEPKIGQSSSHLLPPSPAELFGDFEFRQSLQGLKISRDVTEAINAFSSRFVEIAASAINSDYVLSAYSLSTVMAMLMAGSKGDTYKEIQEAFGFPENPNATYTGFQILQSNMKDAKKNDATLVASNRLFIKEGFPILEDFQWVLKQKFGAPAQQVDFSAPNVHQKINKIVAQDTRDKIQELVQPGTFNNYTRLVALNTMFFKGTWANQFLERATKTMDFTTLSGNIVKKEMMTTEDFYRTANLDFLDAKAVAMPYEGSSKMEMVLIVPNQKDGLRAMESKLSATEQAYEKITQKLKGKAKNILLTVPRFSIESKHDIENFLRLLGVSTAFDEFKADFSNIAGSEYQLHLSSIIQKAILTVNEAGSEAGVATYGTLFIPLSVGPRIEDTIIIDRSFLGFIRDPTTNLILFQFRKAE